MKKKRVAFVIASGKQAWMLKPFVNSLRKFHSEEELPLIVYGDKEMDAIQDPAKFYRATPMFANRLIDDYELVIKFDVDQIVTGKLNYIFDSDYEVGVVYNWNRVDPRTYGEVGLCTILPQEYFNCGFVAMRSKKFIEKWWNMCISRHFDRMPMREQGFLNILCHYGDYKVRCFDDYDVLHNYSSWHGLASKGEWNKVVMRNGEMVLPAGKDGYPNMDKVIRLIHWAGGDNEQKMDYKIRFNEECITYLDYLTGDKNERKETQITTLI